MPYLGLSSFLPYSNLQDYFHGNKVSMPYLGLSSFLRFSNPSSPTSFKGFNALPRAFFFSTLSQNMPTRFSKNVSMPYLGLSSFLQYVKREICLRYICVSMPYLGLSSFLPKIEKIYQGDTEMFQCPTSGFLLFYIKSDDLLCKVC